MNKLMQFYERFAYLPIPESLMGKLIDGDKKELENLKNLKKVNIFIGANNSGKSYILRELIKQELSTYYFNENLKRKIFDDHIKFLIMNISDIIEEMPNKLQIGKPDFRSIPLKEKQKRSFIINLINKESGNSEINLIDFFKLFESDNFDDNYEIIHLIEYCDHHLNLLVNNDINGYNIYGTSGSGNEVLNKFKTILIKYFQQFLDGIKEYKTNENFILNKIYIHYDRSLNKQTIDKNLNDYINKNYFDKLIQIDDGFKQNESSNLPFITGINIYNQLFQMLHKTSKERMEYKEFEDFISSEFFKGVGFSITPYQDMLNAENPYNGEIRVKIGNEEEDYLHNLGTGIQMIILLTYPLFFFRNGIIFVEEPELFIHPGLQKQLIDIYANHLKSENFQFYISTHSNHIIDIVDYSNRVSLFMVKKNIGIESETKFSISHFDFGEISIYDLIGVSASSVAYANCLILVEGPTDRLYIKKWIELFLEEEQSTQVKKLVEGYHYQFMFYGGKLLSHYSVKESGTKVNDEDTVEIDNFLNIFKINKNIIFVADRDKPSTNDDLKPAVKKIASQIDIIKGYSWITDNREIEHYLPYDLINKLKDDDDLEKLKNEISFEKWLQVNKSKMKTPKPIGKVEFAKMILNIMDRSIIANNKDLSKHINTIIDKIKGWNNLK
ncbi:MAG: hypothetical protein HW421_1078 [Ignavibacteria bacterium]|nr:hypothetical protein [Ignavibacteria bacterium]